MGASLISYDPDTFITMSARVQSVADEISSHIAFLNAQSPGALPAGLANFPGMASVFGAQGFGQVKETLLEALRSLERCLDTMAASLQEIAVRWETMHDQLVASLGGHVAA